MKDSLNLGEFLPLPYSSCSNLLGLGLEMNDQITPEQPSSRWNPTAEQLLALEEMYRRGTRTPSADQIQQIASQLRRFGKIEGKNVFYWFQNHKARERQKRRREADTTPSKLRNFIDHAGILDNKDSGLKPAFQLQQRKTLSVSSSNCTENLEGPFPIHKGGTAESKINHNGWAVFEDNQIHNNLKSCYTEKNYTWHDLNNNKTRFFNIEENLKPNNNNNNNNNNNQEDVEIETLELFPISKSSSENGVSRRRKLNVNDRKVPRRAINTKQYFEFLN